MVNMVPLLRFEFPGVFTNLYDRLLHAWNLPDPDEILMQETMQNKFQQAIHDERHPHSRMFVEAIADVSGALNAPRYVRLYIIWAADLILIFESLFWIFVQPEMKDAVLTSAMVEKALDGFRRSDTRKSVHGLIKGDIGHDVSRASKVATVEELLERVIRTFGMSNEQGSGHISMSSSPHNSNLASPKRPTSSAAIQPDASSSTRNAPSPTNRANQNRRDLAVSTETEEAVFRMELGP